MGLRGGSLLVPEGDNEGQGEGGEPIGGIPPPAGEAEADRTSYVKGHKDEVE